MNNLYCYAKGDTISVLKTKGFYSPITNIWYGDKGIVNWSRVGLDENQVYVELSDYKIKTMKPWWNKFNGKVKK